MSGRVDRMRVLPGKGAELAQVVSPRARDGPGFRFTHIPSRVNDSRDLTLVVGIDGEATNHINAQSPTQHVACAGYCGLLAADLERHGGENTSSETTIGLTSA